MSPTAAPARLRLTGEACWLDASGRALALERKDALMLAYLAIQGPTARAALATMLWPDVDDRRARANLRQRLFRLRRTLGFDLLEGAVVARLRADVAVDLQGDLAEAEDLLAGLTDADAGGLGCWLDSTRSQRRAQRVETLAAEASRLESSGQLAPALAFAQRLVDLDSTSEHAHRRVMRLHYLRGDRAAALAAFDHCCDVLEQALGVAPGPETETLRARIEALSLPLALQTMRPIPVSVLRPPRLIGRAREFDTLQQAWHSGQPCTVIAEAGLGKTRLLEALAESRPHAVRVAARPGDGGVPFATLARLLRAVLQHAAGSAAELLLPATRQQLARVLPEWGDAPSRGGEGQRFALQRAVHGLLVGVPPLEGIAIDDLHFADAASLDMLQALLDGSDDSGSDRRRPLRWVLAYRPAEAGTPLRAFHDALLDIALPARVALLPLDRDDIAQLVDSLALPGVDGAALAPQLLRLTGGNPLFMLESLKQAWADGDVAVLAAKAPLTRPRTVQQLIERRLSQLSAQALTLARVAAVAASSFDIALAEHVLGESALQLATAWNELESAQVFRDGGFAHDLVYEATLASVPHEIARTAHAAVARFLAAHGGEPARVAEHWLAAGADTAAVAPLREAARRSTARTCIAEARVLLERAAAICAVACQRADEFAVLFELHANYIVDDPGTIHDELVQRLQTLATGETEALDAAWARHNLRRFRQTTSPIAELQADVERAERLGDGRVLAALVTMLLSGHLVLGQPDEAAALLLRHQALFEASSRRTELADFHGNLADILGEQDRFDDALRHLARATEIYRAADEPAEVMVGLCNPTRHLRQQGRIVAAQARFDDIDRWHAANAPNPRAWMVSRGGASEVLRELGRYAESLHRLQQPVAEMRAHMGRLYPAFPLAQAKLWLTLGQHARAGQAVGAMNADLASAPPWLQARCGLASVQVAVRLRGAGERDQPDSRQWQMLEAAALLAPRDQRRSAWFECELQRAAWLAPTTGAALAESIDLIATHHGMVGYAQQAKLCAAAQRLAAGQTAAALRLARAAQADQQHRFADATEAEPVHPSGGSEAQRDLVIVQVLLAAGESDAHRLLADAQRRLTTAIEQHTPREFQASSRHMNPVHRELLSLAQRLL